MASSDAGRADASCGSGGCNSRYREGIAADTADGIHAVLPLAARQGRVGAPSGSGSSRQPGRSCLASGRAASCGRAPVPSSHASGNTSHSRAGKAPAAPGTKSGNKPPNCGQPAAIGRAGRASPGHSRTSSAASQCSAASLVASRSPAPGTQPTGAVPCKRSPRGAAAAASLGNSTAGSRPAHHSPWEASSRVLHPEGTGRPSAKRMSSRHAGGGWNSRDLAFAA